MSFVSFSRRGIGCSRLVRKSLIEGCLVIAYSFLCLLFQCTLGCRVVLKAKKRRCTRLRVAEAAVDERVAADFNRSILRNELACGFGRGRVRGTRPRRLPRAFGVDRYDRKRIYSVSEWSVG